MQTTFAGSHSDYRTWLSTIQNTHQRRIEVHLLTLDHDHVADLSKRFVDGEITVDVTRDVTRILTLDLFDPDQSLHFEPDSPGTIPIHFSRMIKIRWSVRVPALSRWVTCVPFTGRITDFDRDGARVSITCEGKERMALGQAGRGIGYEKKAKKTDTIKSILRTAGETRMNIPNLGATLPDRVTLRTVDPFWPRAVKIAKSIGYDLFYDGRGVAQMRKPSGRPCFTFDAKTLATEVSIDRVTDGVKNRWIVLGGKPKGSKTRVHADVQLPRNNPLSSHKLGRTVAGDVKPYYLIDQEENGDVKTTAAATAIAVQRRDESLKTLATYAFDALPVPHLEEYDLVRVETPEGTFLVRMRFWTLPLGIDGAPTMAISSKKLTSLSPGRHKGTRVAVANILKGFL